jgi:hypothetical protein
MEQAPISYPYFIKREGVYKHWDNESGGEKLPDARQREPRLLDTLRSLHGYTIVRPQLG